MKLLKESFAQEQTFNTLLAKQFDDWQKSHNIRLFIEAKKAASTNEDIENWLLRANAQADFFDPFSNVNEKRIDGIESEIKERSNEIYDIKKKFSLLDLPIPKHYWH